MWGRAYWGPGYWSATYWPPSVGAPVPPTVVVGGGGKRHPYSTSRRHRNEETQVFLADALYEQAQAEDLHQMWLQRRRHEEDELVLAFTFMDDLWMN
jgi:hypothetical protein